MENSQPTRSLVRKLNEIMKEVGYLQKKGHNQKQKYNFIQEADVIEAVREKMIERNLVIFPETEEIIVTPSGTTKSGSSKMLTTLKMKYTIVDGDSGEERVISTGGQGEDMGDKGIYKATTGANKYGLLKLFQIPTGDDPEIEDPKAGQDRTNNGQAQRNQGQRNNNAGQNNPPPDPYGGIEFLGTALNYSFEQLMQLINAARGQKSAPPVNHFREMDPQWIKAIETILNSRMEKQRQGGQK